MPEDHDDPELHDPIAKFAARLDHLLNTLIGPDGGPWTHVQLANALTERGITTTPSYISHLRVGRRGNPPSRTLGVLAQILRVPVEYFFDDDVAEQLNQDLQLLVAIREANVDGLALLARGMPQSDVEAVEAMLRQLRAARGLPEV